MNTERVLAMYFSPTGTTKSVAYRVASGLAAKLNCSLEERDFTLPAAREKSWGFSNRDLVVFAVPVYAGRVPNVLLNFLKTLDGADSLAVPIVLYGNRNYDDALIELRDLLETDGFHTLAAGAFIGEHAFSTILAAGRPDNGDLKIADELAAGTLKKLKDFTAPPPPVSVKGESPLRPYYVPRDRQGNKVNILKVKPKTNDGCNNCKQCVEVCPMGSISPDDVHTFTGICIKCGACVKKCPRHAKYYDDANYLYHQRELEEGYVRRAEPELFF